MLRLRFKKKNDGTAVIIERSVQQTAAGLGHDAENYAKLIGPLVRDWPKIQSLLTGTLADKADDRLPLPGTLLSRKWKGRTILVEVLAKGFRYEKQYYSSLSAIAVAITGTRWNGISFFGLTRPAGGQRKERLHAEK